jgi:DNA primase
MAIPQTFIQELLDRTDVVEVVKRYVATEKRWRQLHGAVPLPWRKITSFSVSPTKQFCHCFEFGKNGNAIGFLMDHAGMNFVEAVKDLAQNAGMQVPEEDVSPKTASACTSPPKANYADRSIGKSG